MINEPIILKALKQIPVIQSILTSIAVLLRITANPLGNVFQKQLIHRGNNPLIINFLTYAFLSFLCLFFVFDIQWYEFPASFWFYSLMVGILGAFGNGFLVKALEKGDLSVLGPINSYKSIVGIIAGIFLLGEIPGIWGMLGVFLIVAGSYFILDTTVDRFSWKLLKSKAIQFRFFALLFTAIEAIFVKKVIIISSQPVACIIWCGFGAAFSFVFLLFWGISPVKELSKLKLSDIGKAIFLVICVGMTLVTTIYTFDHLPVGYALSLFQLSTVGSVVLGHQFFDEQDIRKKLMGAVIMIVGSIVIILCKDF